MARSAALVPTRRAIVAIALAAPVALLLAAVDPQLWVIVPAFGLVVLLLVVADALLAGRLDDYRLALPADVEIGATETIGVVAEFTRGRRASVAAALAGDPRLLVDGRAAIALAPAAGGDIWEGAARFTPLRRGAGTVSGLWLRWTGPFGLGARQRVVALDRAVRIWPNLADVRSPALQTFLRDAQFGLIARRVRGEGTQFEALADYQPGMDRRRIDWKASARHAHLYAKENETERNNQIVFAIDCGQAMCEPVAGLPRIDRAISAALTAAYVALKGGDRVALFGFAARPEVATPFVTDPARFRQLQIAAAGLDYRAEEPNFTLALATLAARLQRRSLIVVFSDFTDPTSAELMVESVARLVRRHVVLFVTLVDDELTGIARAAPGDLQDVAMAVTADALLRQRALVIGRLRQLGVDTVEAPHDRIGTRLIDAYLAVKRRGAIG